MTENAFDEKCDDCMEAGMIDHLLKPADPQHLYAILLKWLEEAK